MEKEKNEVASSHETTKKRDVKENKETSKQVEEVVKKKSLLSTILNGFKKMVYVLGLGINVLASTLASLFKGTTTKLVFDEKDNNLLKQSAKEAEKVKEVKEKLKEKPGKEEQGQKEQEAIKPEDLFKAINRELNISEEDIVATTNYNRAFIKLVEEYNKDAAISPLKPELVFNGKTLGFKSDDGIVHEYTRKKDFMLHANPQNPAMKRVVATESKIKSEYTDWQIFNDKINKLAVSKDLSKPVKEQIFMIHMMHTAIELKEAGKAPCVYFYNNRPLDSYKMTLSSDDKLSLTRKIGNTCYNLLKDVELAEISYDELKVAVERMNQEIEVNKEKAEQERKQKETERTNSQENEEVSRDTKDEQSQDTNSEEEQSQDNSSEENERVQRQREDVEMDMG